MTVIIGFLLTRSLRVPGCISKICTYDNFLTKIHKMECLFRNAIIISTHCFKDPYSNELFLPKYTLFYNFFYRQTNRLGLTNLYGAKIANKYLSNETRKSTLAPPGAEL